MVPRQQLAAPDVIWDIYSHLHWLEEAPTMGKVPCEFQADRPGFSFSGEELRQGSFQPCPAQHGVLSMTGGSRCDLAHFLAPVLLLEDGGRDLPSSGDPVLTMGQVSCEFWADQPGFSFSGEELRQGSFQPCPAQDGASFMAGSYRCDFGHLLTPALLLEGWW